MYPLCCEDVRRQGVVSSTIRTALNLNPTKALQIVRIRGELERVLGSSNPLTTILQREGGQSAKSIA